MKVVLRHKLFETDGITRTSDGGSCRWSGLRPMPKIVRHVRSTMTLLTVLAGCCGYPSLLLAATHYVSPTGGNVPPYADWANAATVIQAAIAVAATGDTVLVTNGIYGTGGLIISGLLSNRVAINMAIIVQSVNGPQLTTIQGNGPAGDTAVRCAYVGANATLSGFTLTNGYTRSGGNVDNENSGGGVWCNSSAIVTNCWIIGNVAQNFGGGSYQGTLNNCTLTQNLALWSGGGSYFSTLNNCALIENSASDSGGGTFEGTLNSCTLMRNCATNGGGGSCLGTLNNCTLIENLNPGAFPYYGGGGGGGGALGSTLNNCLLKRNSSYANGGGANGAVLNNCTLIGNVAGSSAFSCGGGSYGGELKNCTLTGNFASSGGGSYGGMLNNCTVTDNSVSLNGGGSYNDTLNNCIVYHNKAFISGSNYTASTFNSSCTAPMPANGTNNISDDPLLGSSSHLTASSPCIGAGSSAYTSGVDVDGELWRNPPCVGVDQYVAGSLTGALTMMITAASTNVVAGYAVNFAGHNQGRLGSSTWDFGDGATVNNRAYISHSWSAPGTYAVRLTGYNTTYPGGSSAQVIIQVTEPVVYYVAANNPTPLYPYSTWQTAATSIQTAIDAGTTLGRLVLVTNGVYDSGGRAVHGLMTNRVALPDGVCVRSVNGPGVTRIVGAPAPNPGGNGDGAIRCAYVGESAVLGGFALTNGHTRANGDLNQEQGGGGVWCEASGIVSNCWLTGNSAAYAGGGSYRGMLSNCSISNNSATYAGGAGGCSLNACTLAGNSAVDGGGTYWCTLNNCVLIGNYASNGGGGDFESTLNNCLVVGNAAGVAGASQRGNLNNCTVVGNSANNIGGVNGGALNNSILYYNTPANYNAFSGQFGSCCTTPLPEGDGNITAPPLFKDMAGGDYRLSPSSPCIDVGLNQPWMFTGTDLEGKPRILNGRVDMGAYETAFDLNLRVLLQGAYDTNAHAMRPSLPAMLPLTSPYAGDLRQVSVLPSNVVDWVLIELRSTNGNVVVTKSAFLDAQGQLLSVDGSAGIAAEVSAGLYAVAVKHRNHLAAISAQPVAFTNTLVSFDFTVGAGQFAGGSIGSVQLEPGIWGLIAGDADGDGAILPVDAIICTNQLGQTGYSRADFNLDGVVSSNDFAFCLANQALSTAVTNGETPLLPALTITPLRQTVLSGNTITFSATGTTNPVNWALAANPSGGTLVPLSATSAVYTAGSGSNSVDIVEAWDGNLLGRSWVNVISAADVTKVGKAIIIAGQRSADDPVWPTTDYLGNLAYNTLLYRGFGKGNIRYLSPDISQDVDGNGTLDDVALSSTLTNAVQTFTNWAMSNPSQLFVYLVDHGGTASDTGYFRLNPSEVLTPASLNQWLDAIQNRYGIDVVVVLDFCEAGSFLDPLKHSGPGKRTVISACASNEPTYFVAGGQVSFSDAFFGGLLTGLDLADAFTLARDAMSVYQSAGLDANGDGIYTPGTDPAQVVGTYVGASFIAGKDIPQIGHVLGDQMLYGDTTATLWAYDISSAYELSRVWCLVVPPGHNPNPTNPVADLPLLEMAYNPGTGRYEAQYSGFSEMGIYKLVYYAKDIWESVSLPQQSYVFQNGFQERVILVAGGNTNDAARWPATDNLARLAYNTFRSRHLDASAIRYLNPLGFEDVDHDGTNDVAAVSSLANLSYAINNWALGANKLTVYLVGDGTNGTLRLNPAEALASADLKSWLDVYQASNGQAQVVMDFSGSGAFLPVLKAPSSLVRICVASSQAGKTSLFGNGGIVSFGEFFLSSLFNGDSLGQAFGRARDSIKLASGSLKQTALLDDNGDGLSTKTDGAVAATHYIGAAFRTGGDPPVIGSVMSNAVVMVGQPLVLWAQDVTAVAGISNVWCVITPPDYGGSGDLPQLDLAWNAGASRYEAVYTNFTELGTYACTFYAQDNDGVMSSPEQTQVMVTDAYEVDDSAALATRFPVGDVEQHNLHSPIDEDWVKFYAPAGFVFNIEAKQLGTNSDLALDLYYEQWDGTLSWMDGVDDYGWGEGETESLAVDLKSGASGLWPGIYYLRVSSADTNRYGSGSEYELRIYEPTGTGGGVIMISFGGGSGLLAYLQVHITPQVAGAGWRLQGQTAYHTNADYTEAVSSGGSPAIEFRPLAGWDGPPGSSFEAALGATTIIPATYTRSGQLGVSPAGQLGFSGFVGGPINPTSQTCLLTNSGEGSLWWSATGMSNWVSLSATNGILARGGQTNISVSINTNASVLTAGSYTSTIGFLNQSNGLGNTTRMVSLSLVAAHPPVLLANPQVLADGRLALTLQGVSNGVYSILGTTNLLEPVSGWTEVLRLTNSGVQTLFTNPPPASAAPQYYRAREW